MLLRTLSADYLSLLKPLTMAEILWAYRLHLVNAAEIISYFVLLVDRKLTTGCFVGEEELQIAGLLKSEESEVEHILVAASGETPETIDRDKWAFILLKWIYENQSDFENPLVCLADVYEGLGYLPSIEHLVYYMPPTDGIDRSQLSYSQCIDLLYAKWKLFLEEKSTIYLNR